MAKAAFWGVAALGRCRETFPFSHSVFIYVAIYYKKNHSPRMDTFFSVICHFRLRQLRNFWKKLLNSFPGHTECSCDNPAEKFSFEVWKNLWNFPKTFFTPKCFSGYLKCTFHNPAENILLKVPKSFALSSKKVIFFFKKNPSRFSYSGHVKCNFDKPKYSA